MSERVTASSELGTRCWGLGTRENPSEPGPPNPTPTYARDRLGCEMAEEVLRSWGELRLRVTGTSMLPTVWPGDILCVESRGAAEAVPGDVVLFGREGRLVAHRVVEVRKQVSGVGCQVSGDPRSSESGATGSTSEVRGPKSLSRVASRESRVPVLRVPVPESRIVVTRGDSLGDDDPPITGCEILGRVTAIERGSRRFAPPRGLASRLASWILSRSDFATRAVLKIRRWALGAVRDTDYVTRVTGLGLRDSACRIAYSLSRTPNV